MPKDSLRELRRCDASLSEPIIISSREVLPCGSRLPTSFAMCRSHSGPFSMLFLLVFTAFYRTIRQPESSDEVNMVDMHIDRPLPHHSVYSLAKGALATLTKSLALDMAPDVRVNAIAPGAILLPERALTEQEKQQMLASIPLGELGRSEDIAQTMAFLVNSPYITGQIVYVDGGRSLHTGASA